MTHRMQNARNVVGTPWWLRLCLYVVVAIGGLIATALGLVEPADVDNWLAQAVSLGALIGGGMAAVHVEKPARETASDESALLDGFTAYPQEVHGAQ